MSKILSFGPGEQTLRPEFPRRESRPPDWLRRGGTLFCVLLVLLTGFVAVAHFHPNSLRSPDRSCSLCALAHAGVAVNNIATPAPIFVPSVPVETPAIASHSFLPLSLYYIRPPPQV